MTERKTQRAHVQPSTPSGQDPDAFSLPTGRRSGPITYRIELVAVAGEEGEALFKNQQAAVLSALQWAVANSPESEHPGLSGIAKEPPDADTVASGTISAVEPRPLTPREQAVLEALLAVDFDGVESLRRQAANVVVVGKCDCGCPTIDFQTDYGLGMSIGVNASIPGTDDGLFLYTVEDPDQGEILGGIEWVGVEATNPTEFPEPKVLDIDPA